MIVHVMNRSKPAITHCIRRAIPSVIVAGSLCLAVFSQADTLVETTVFDRGEGGYYGFRIPAIVQAQDGSILAFAEARKNSLSDNGDIDMVAKRSVDGGLSGREVTVELPGGALDIAWREDGSILMTGPATESFRGSFAWEDYAKVAPR